MEITHVRVYPLVNGRMRALAEIIFDSCFVVSDLMILKGREGFVVEMPDVVQEDGSCRVVAEAITLEMKTAIEQAVLAEYKRVNGATAARRTKRRVWRPT